VLALSSAAEAIIARRDAIAYRNRRLVTLHRTGLGDALERMIKEVLQLRDGASETAPPVLRLRRRGTEFSYHVSAFPLVGYEADSWERRCRIVLFIQDPERPAIPNARVLQQLFTLTDREARTVALLAEGQRVACIAETLGVTRETVKSHLAAAFRKTETHCQGELVACVLKHLGGLAPKA
jgi:DNA-binding CsgD family transcriptional regulator